MERTTILLAVALVAVTGTASAVIWEQHKQIRALEARTLAPAGAADLLAELKAPLPSTTADPETTAETESPPVARASEATPEPTAPEAPDREEMRERMALRFAEMLSDPEISSLLLSQRKASLDSRYAALFQKLGLSPADTEKLKELLAERQMSRMEAGVMARAEGVGRDDREGMRDVLKAAEADADAELAAFLGPDRYKALKSFEQNGSERSAVNQFSTRLSYSPTPLQGYQADAMVQLLASTQQPRAPGRNATAQETAAYMQELQSYNNQIISRARSFLSPDQVNALAQMQQEQVDQQRLAELMPRWGGGRFQQQGPGGGRR